MKAVYILLVVTILAGTALPFHPRAASLSESPLRLQGKLIKAKKTTAGATDIFDLELELEFGNSGTKPIILLLGTYSNGEWWLLNTMLTLDPTDDKAVLYKRGAAPSNSSSMPRWRKLRRQLDREVPSKGLTHLLAPGEKFVYRLTTFVEVSGNDRQMLDRNLWLRVQLELWPENIETDYYQARFRNHLSQRWAKRGVLQFSSIISEPIPVKLH
jgi:hypothetical protein